MSYNPLKLDGIEIINIFNKDGEQTLATGGDQGIIVTGPSTINSSLTINPGNNRIKFWEGSNSVAQIGLRDSSTNEVFLQGWGSDFRIAVGGTNDNHALVIDNAKNTKLYGDLMIIEDGNEFWLKSTDYNLARIIPRGSSGVNLDKGLFSLMASDGTNNNIEKVRIDSAGGSWFDGGDFRLGAGDLTIGGKAYPKLFLDDNQGVARSFSVGTNNETFTVRNETSSTNPFIIEAATNNATFSNDVTVGANLKSTGSNLRFHAGGNHIINIDLNGKFYPQTDNSVDLGFNDSSYRFRNLFMTGTADIPSIYLHDYIYHKGDTDTYIRFQTDHITLRANAKDILNLGWHGGVSTNNTGTNVGQFAYAGEGLIADNLGGANMIRKGTDIAVQASAHREEVMFIDGTKVQAHTSTGNGTNTHCYQWYTSENIKVNPEKDYEFSVWIKSTGDDHLYLGWHEFASNGNRITSNPYFHTNKIKTYANSNNTGTVVANINGWTKLTFKLKSHRTTSGQADSVADRNASSNRTQASGISGVTGVMHSTTSLVHLRLGTCYGSVNGSKSWFYNAKIIEAQDDDYKFDLNVGEWSNISDLSISNLLTVGPGTTGSPYDATTFLHVKGTTRSIVQQSSTADAYYMFGDAGANNAAWLGYNHSTGVLDLHSETSILLDKGTTIQGTLSVTGTNVTVSNATNPYIYLNDTNAGAALFQQEGNDTRIGSDSNTTVKIIQNNQDAVTIDTNKKATFVGALDVRGSGYNQIKIASNLTANANKQSGIVTENYEGNDVSILQTFQQNDINSIYYGSADSSYAGVQNHYFFVNTDSDTATSGHTKAFQIKKDLASTFYGSLTITGATTFNSSAAIPSATSHLLIGSTISTTGKIKFGSTSWKNDIGLESFWMVLGCNQNEGFKFRSSTGVMLMQINGNNNSLTASDNMQAGPNSVVFNNIAVAKSKFYDYDAIVPNKNLLDIDSIKIASNNDQYGNATKTTISPYVARYTNDNTGSSTIRLYVDDNQLIDGDNYMVSVYYENLIGTLNVDFCDVSVTGNGSQVGTSSAPKSGRIYGYASRSDYNSTYRFFDINLNQGSGHTVTLHSPKVEAGTLLTDFVATERVDMPTNSNHVRDLVTSNTITTYGNATFHHGSTTYKTTIAHGNEINTFTEANGSATMYLNWRSGAVNIAKALIVQPGATGSAAFGGTVTAKNTTISPNVGSGTAEVLTVNHGSGSHTGVGIQVNSANSGHALNVTGSVGGGYLRITSAYNNNPTISLSGGIIAGGTITAGDITGAELTSKHAVAPVLKLRREDTSIIEGDSIGTIYFQGDDPSATNTGAAIKGVAAGTWNMGSPNVYPSKLVFQTAKQNALITALTIDEDQDSTFLGKIIAKSSTGVGDIYLGNNHTGNYARFHTNNSNTYFDMNCGVVYWRQGSNTRFQHNMTSGTFTSSGDIVAYGSPSDIRLKENIKPIESALAKVDKLQGVTFDWKDSESILKIKEDIGFIAQDVQKVLPELVRENENGMLSMRHQGITPILLEAIKELKAEIEELKKQIK